MKKLIAFALLSISLITNGQDSLNTIVVPSYANLDSNASVIYPGQVYKTVITNNSSHAISIHPYLNRTGMERIAWSDSFLLAYLYSQINGMVDTDAIRLKLVQIMATKIEKTDIFANNHIIYDAWADSNAFDKQNSLIGALAGTYQKQCGNYIQNSIAILIQTGYFNYSNIEVVELMGHVTGQFIYNGGWCFFDLDPSEPFFMIKNPLNTNGFASPMDIKNNPNLITDDQRYRYVNEAGDSVVLYFTQSLQNYQSKFNSIQIVSMHYTSSPLSVSGTITIPSKSSLISIYQNTFYILDSANLSTFNREYNRVTGNLDSAIKILSNILHISHDSSYALMRTLNGFTFLYDTKDWNPNEILSYIASTIPTVQITLPASVSNTTIQEHAINFPGYITASTIPINYSDTFYNAGIYPALWNNTNDTDFSVTDHMVHYLSNDGDIPSHSTTDTLTLSYNPIIVNFATGFKLGYSDGDSILIQTFINDTLVSADSTYKTYSIDSIKSNTVEYKNIEYNIYPNPAKNIFLVSGTSNPLSKIQLFDITGKSIATASLNEPVTKIYVDIDNGIYVYRITSVDELISTGKIVIAK